MRRSLRSVATCLAATLVATACSRIVVEQEGERQVVGWNFGVTTLAPMAGAETRLVRLTGFGLMSTPDSVVAGYHDAAVVFVGRDCQVVFWTETAETARQITAFLGQRRDICAVSAN